MNDVYELFSENSSLSNSTSVFYSAAEIVKRYTENPLIPVAHIFLRILLSLSSVRKPHINDLLNQSMFGRFFVEIVRKQH